MQNHRRDSAGKYRRQILSTRDRAAPWSMFAEPSGLTGKCTGERYRPWSPEWTFQVHGGDLLASCSMCMTGIAGTGHGRSWRLVASCRLVLSYKRSLPAMSAQEEDSPETTNLHSTALADPGESTPPPHKDTCTLLLTIWSSSPHLARGAPICVGVSALENSFPDLLAQ